MEGQKITVGIAAYNEERGIAGSIGSALDSSPKVGEVLVVASGCTDRTADITREMAKEDGRIRLILEKERGGKGSAINLILRNAKGSLIVMTDGDLTFPEHSINELALRMVKGVGAVSGRPEYFAASPMFSWWGRFASECASRQREKGEKLGYHAISGYLYALRKGAVTRIPPRARSEDAYVGQIVRQAGYEIRYAKRAVVNVGYAENIMDYLTQKIRTHYGHLEVFQEAGANGPMKTAIMAGGIRGEMKEYFRVASSHITSPIEYGYFALYLLVEFSVWVMAFLKFYFREEEKWKQIRSTKK
ncbi:MAG: glycosyltransferase [Candidatus Micrarchaeota archaeon]